MAESIKKEADLRLEEASQAQEILAKYEGDPSKKVLWKVCCMNYE